MQRAEELVRGGQGWVEAVTPPPPTRWPQVHVWGMRYKPRAEPSLGPLLTTATPWPLLLMDPASCGKEWKLHSFSGNKETSSPARPCRLPPHPRSAPGLTRLWEDSGCLEEMGGKTETNEAVRQGSQKGLRTGIISASSPYSGQRELGAHSSPNVCRKSDGGRKNEGGGPVGWWGDMFAGRAEEELGVACWWEEAQAGRPHSLLWSPVM